MRPSHHLCSLVPSIHRLSTAISDRPSHNSSFASPSRKRSRPPTASVLLSSPIPGALSYHDSFEPYVPKEAGLGVDFEDESYEPSMSRGTDLEEDVDVVRSDRIDIDPEIQAEIDKCIAYADSLKDRGIDARVVVEAIDREETETGMRGLAEVRVDRVTHPVVADDIPEPAKEGAVEVTYETLGDLVQRFHDHTEEILVHRVQATESVTPPFWDNYHGEHYYYGKQLNIIIWLNASHYNGKITVDKPNTRSGASRTLRESNEAKRSANVISFESARPTVRNLDHLMGE
ncbi:hypothetical protein Tco_0772643 [Tanacetum coccineum]|uniref:Uncharacterized protein n=1 Tax=Tanacetum coccineum TaxID=301880 RepID=A0ABQ4ZLD1_9ASTR